MALPASRGFVGATPVDRFRAFFDIPQMVPLAALAANAMPLEVPLAVVHTHKPVVLDGALFVPGAAITQDASDYVTIEVGYRRAGGAFVPIASYSTAAASGTIAAFSENQLTVSAPGSLRQGDVITVVIDKAASGQALPTSSLVLVFS